LHIIRYIHIMSNVDMELPTEIWEKIIDMAIIPISEHRLEKLNIGELEELDKKLKKIKTLKYNEIKNKKYKRDTILKDKYERYWIISSKKRGGELYIYRMEYNPIPGVYGYYHSPNISQTYYMGRGILNIIDDKIIINNEILDFDIIQYQGDIVKKRIEEADNIKPGDNFGIFLVSLAPYSDIYMNQAAANYTMTLSRDAAGSSMSASSVTTGIYMTRTATKITAKNIYCLDPNHGGTSVFSKSECTPI